MKNKMERLSIAGRLEVKLADPNSETAEKTFAGFGAVFNNVDQARDIILPGAFKSTLAEHKANGTMPAMFFNHDAYSIPIGVWDEMSEDEHGLKVSGRFIDTTGGRDAYVAAKAGAITGLSIGYFVTDYTTENGVRIISEVKLFEVSVVTFPCNELAKISGVKSMNEDLNEEDFVSKLAEFGVEENDAKLLFAKLNKSDEAVEEEASEKSDVEAEGEEEKAENASEDESEAKYHEAAIEAVNNLIRQLQQENHG